MVAGRPSGKYQLRIGALAFLMVFTVLLSLNGFWQMGVDYFPLLFLALVASGFAWLSWRTPLGTGLLLVVGAAAAVLAFYRLPAWTDYLRTLVAELTALVGSLLQADYETELGPILGAPALLLTASAFAMLIMQEALRRGRAFWTILAGFVVFGIEWSWFFDRAASYSGLYGILAFVLWVVSQAALRDARWKETSRKVGYSSGFVSPLVWILVAALVAGILPDEISAASLGAWATKIQESFPVLERLRGGGIAVARRFSLTSTGFSPRMDVLGGPARVDDSVSMTVALDYPLQETYYLRGSTFQTYTGSSWLRGEPDLINVPSDGNLLSDYSLDVMTGSVRMEITHQQNLGFTLFNLLEPVRADGARGTFKADADGNTWVDRTIRRGSPYTVISRIPRYSADQIRLLSTSEPGQYMAPYLALPPDLPERVATLTASLTADQEHPYDKAVALEQYLRTLRYTLNVPFTPPDRDFVDYFLHDLEEGYCLYSASAMAVMLRTQGIPARLVEGFALATRTPYDRNESGQWVYEVRNSQAHAWVEAYFPGYGWVTFDPTPRDDLPVIDRSMALPASSRPENVEPATSTRDPRDPNMTEDDRETAEDLDALGPKAQTSPLTHWPWYAGGALLIGFLLFLAFRRIQGQERITAHDGRGAVQEFWLKIGWILGLFGFAPRPDQTPQEYAATVGASWPTLTAPVERAALDYTEARYSPPERPVDAGAPGRAKKLWQEVNDTLAVRFGWRSYLWRRLSGRPGKQK